MRIATDCSGMAVPEMALEELAEKQGAALSQVFACDVWSGSQQWLMKLGCGPVLTDMAARVWRTTGTIKAITVEGATLEIQRSPRIDLYICGFMCTPFTPNGHRKAWQDEHSATFWNAMKTISTLLPRAFILENVCSLANNSNSKVVDDAFAKLKAFRVVKVRVNATEFGIPQHRPRIFMIGLAKDSLREVFASAADTVLQEWVLQRIRKCIQTDPPNFREFLQKLGFPLSPNVTEEAEDAECSCHVGSLCGVHSCQCSSCKGSGEGLKCLWRKKHKQHMKGVAVITKRRKYLAMWRKVKKDPKLKKAPDYFQLASQKSLNTGWITSPSRRCMLQGLSETQNLMKPHAVLKLSKTLGRNSARDDGILPTLGYGCTAMFVPSVARNLSVPQLLCLTGACPTKQQKAFETAESMKVADMDLLIGNAMVLPVIGTVSAVALCMLSAPQ